MTDWSRVEFADTSAKSRKAHDYLPILSETLAFWDFVACIASGQAALVFYSAFVVREPLSFATSGPFLRDIMFGSLLAAIALRDHSALQKVPTLGWKHLVLRAEMRCLVVFAILITVGVATRETSDLARLWLFMWLAIFTLVIACTRMACAWYVARLNRRGELRETIAIIGGGQTGERVAARISAQANIIGMFCTHLTDERADSNVDELENLIELSRSGAVDSVILALDDDNRVDLSQVVQRLKSLPVQVAVCHKDGWSSGASPQMRLLGGLPMAVVSDRPLKRWDLLVKTLIDKLGAAVLLVLLAPVVLTIAIAVRSTSAGPIIFRQHRQGWCGRTFVVLKFRTMRADLNETTQLFQTRRMDARCTRVGRILRKCSLDELPQLWNVLKGDMSLVGPRPHADSLHDVDRAGHEVIAEYAQRNRVRPGITGWAQINGSRGATATIEQLKQRVEYDLFYIENWSLWMDVKILLRTPFSMSGENAF